MSFLASARKYRPQTFETVVGQEHITITLKNAIQQNHLAHAFLFCGPRGVGKTSCARILAKTINCTHRLSNGEACDACHNCISFNDGTAFNIYELDAASNNSVEDIRALTEQVRFAPQGAVYKVYIIDEVHMLSTSAFNAFLKTLEEPPSYVIFILATTEKQKILPTILSRCQIFDFKRITQKHLIQHLQYIATKESILVDNKSLQVIAQKSEGCARDALSIFDKLASFTNANITYQTTLEHLNILDEEYFFKWLQSLYNQDLSSVLLLVNEVYQKGFEGDSILIGLSECIRNVFICKLKNASSLLTILESYQETYNQLAQLLPTSFLVSALHICTEAEIQCRSAKNGKLFIESTFIKLCYIKQLEVVSQIPSTPPPIAIPKKNTVAIQENSNIKQTEVVSQIPSTPPPIVIPKKNTVVIQESINTAQPSSSSIEPIPPILSVSNTPQPPPPSLSNVSPTLVVEEKESTLSKDTPITTVHSPNQTSSPPSASPHSRNILESIKQKYNKTHVIDTITSPLALEGLMLQTKWEYLKENFIKNNADKTSFLQALKSAVLSIKDEQTIIIESETITFKKFLEQEKINILKYFQEQFCNTNIKIIWTIKETEVIQPTQRIGIYEQRNQILNTYPLVSKLIKELYLVWE